MMHINSLSSKQISEIADIIKKFIDDIGVEKIETWSLEKIERMYKSFLEDNLKIARKHFKENKPVKKQLDEIYKLKKPNRNLPIKDKIKTYKNRTLKVNKVVEFDNVFYKKLRDGFKQIAEWEKSNSAKWNTYEKFLNYVVDFGEYSYIATHIAKLTNSSSKGSSIDIRYYQSCQKFSDIYLSSCNTTYIDVAYPDNKYSIIAKLYAVNYGNYFIGDLLKYHSKEILDKLVHDKFMLDKWSEIIESYIENKSKQSHFLNKQIYFPVGQDKYHLLLPLVSSSLAHALFLENQKYYDECAGKARKQKKEGLYSFETVRSYPNKAVLRATGSNHSNASALNGKRSGRLFLFSSSPPQWKSNRTLVNKTSIFDKSLSFELKGEVTELRKYLLLLKNKELSMSKPERNIAVVNKLNTILETFFDYMLQLQVNTLHHYQNKTKWTTNTNLPIEQQVFFEPDRQDEEALIVKSRKQWQKNLSNSYGRWLNKQLKNKQLNLTTIHERLWSDHFLLALQNHVVDMEVTP